MNSTLEDLRHTEITSGKKFDYYEEKDMIETYAQKGPNETSNIYFYMTDVGKIKKISGIQFITDRYLRKSKEYYNNSMVTTDTQPSSQFSFEEHQSRSEESKDYVEETESEKEIRKLKFEKYILLLLLGSCDLSDPNHLKKKYADDYKEIILMMKINKINELKRLSKNSINYEILVDMVKEPVDIEDFIQNWLPDLKGETAGILRDADIKLAELLRSSEQLELQIEILKTDIENLDFLKCNQMRMQFIETAEIPVCLQYWTDSVGFKVSDTAKCLECKGAKSRPSAAAMKLQSLTSQDIFFKGVPNIIEKVTEAEEEVKHIENERKSFKHDSFTHIDDFMAKFFDLPIFKTTGEKPIEELKLISQNYKAYLEKLRYLIQENNVLKKKAEENLVWINNLIATKYAKYEIIKDKVEPLDREINQKFYEIRCSNFVPEKLNHSVWNKPMRELKCIEFEKAPYKKMEALVKCLTAVSRAYLLLSDQTDEVTADDILQFSSFIFIKSGINDLAGYLQYIKAFHYTPPSEMQGIEQYCFITAESCLEYLRRLKVTDSDFESNREFEFEIHFETPDEFSMKDDAYIS